MSIEPDYPLLNTPGWHELLERHRGEDAAGFVLRFGGKQEWPVREIAEQLHCYPRAEAKLGPLHRPGMIYLREALEQASGYAAASWRAANWMRKTGEDGVGGNSAGSGVTGSGVTGSESPGNRETLIADLTGGLGIDTAGFALAGAKVHYCERNETLAGIARHNHKLLGISDRVDWHEGDGLEWLRSWNTQGGHKFELVYIDPSRRPDGDRVVTISQSEPDITVHQDLLRAAANRWLIKLSPMMDPVEVMRALPDCAAIIAVSVRGELKELLAECTPAQNSNQGETRKNSRGETRQSRQEETRQSRQGETRQNSRDETRPVVGETHMRAVVLDKTGDELYDSGMIHHRPENDAEGVPAVPAGSLLLEPDPSILKMKLIDETARRFGLSRIHPEIGYLTDGKRRSGPEQRPPVFFPGKTFRIRRILPFKPRKLKRWLAQDGLTKVHIHQRGFPLTVDQLYRKLGCSMGEQAHLFATPAHDGQYVLIVTEKMHPDFMNSPEYPIMSENPSSL